LLSDPSSTEDKLNQLRSEITILLDLPALSPQFMSWLGRLYVLVGAAFGSNSNEMRDLRALSPELPSEFYESIANRLGGLPLEEQFINQLITQLNMNSPEAIFGRRLHEYGDLIAAMIHGLRTKR